MHLFVRIQCETKVKVTVIIMFYLPPPRKAAEIQKKKSKIIVIENDIHTNSWRK